MGGIIMENEKQYVSRIEFYGIASALCALILIVFSRVASDSPVNFVIMLSILLVNLSLAYSAWKARKSKTLRDK